MSGTNGSRTFLRAGLGVTSPVLSDGTADYTPGVSRTASGATTFAHAGLKNTSTQSAENETIAATKVYDAFGNEVSSSGSWQGPFSYAGNFGYQSDANGLKLLGHRYYDSTTGRFITQDPIGDGQNWYAYCRNTPVFLFDPDGLQPMGAAGQIAAGWGDALTDGSWSILGIGYRLLNDGESMPPYTQVVRDWLGVNGVVEPDSAPYAVGNVLGIVNGALIGPKALPRAKIIRDPSQILPLPHSGAVVGNNVQRVKVIGGVWRLNTFSPVSRTKVFGWLENVGWMVKQVVTQAILLDIGPVPGKDAYGWYYKMERAIMTFVEWYQ